MAVRPIFIEYHRTVDILASADHHRYLIPLNVTPIHRENAGRLNSDQLWDHVLAMLPRHPRSQGCISSTSGLLLATHGSLLGTHDSLLGTHESQLSIHDSLLCTPESLLDHHGITDLATRRSLDQNYYC